MRAGVRRAAQACVGCHVFPDTLVFNGMVAQLVRAPL